MKKYILILVCLLVLVSYKEAGAYYKKNTWGSYVYTWDSSSYTNYNSNYYSSNSRNSWSLKNSKSNGGLLGSLGNGAGLWGSLSSNSRYTGPAVVW